MGGITVMPVSGQFKTVINNYLQGRGAADALFKETLQKPGKNLDDCCTYILNEVQKTGNTGFDDSEIFGMAVHYYDEDNIEVGKSNNARVVVNHHVELSAEDKDAAHKVALDRAIAQEQARMAKKPVSKQSTAATNNQQPSLF